jgi:uncharacterized membrane protein
MKEQYKNAEENSTILTPDVVSSHSMHKTPNVHFTISEFLPPDILDEYEKRLPGSTQTFLATWTGSAEENLASRKAERIAKENRDNFELLRDKCFLFLAFFIVLVILALSGYLLVIGKMRDAFILLGLYLGAGLVPTVIDKIKGE